MSRQLTYAAIGFVAVFAAAQLVGPDRTNPATDSSRAFESHPGTAAGLVTVLDRSCRDCHSNKTVWPWYTRIAPLSWVMGYAVAEGRRAVNFSEWGAYQPERQRMLLAASCRDASTAKMPGREWTLLHPDARLSPQDIETICAASRQVDAQAEGR